MQSRPFRHPAVAAAASLAVRGGKKPPPPELGGVFGGIAGAAAGSIARAAGASTTESIVAGAAVGAVVAATVYVIAKRQASERQRKIAEERARAYQRSLTPERKATMKKKKVRYIAVDTVKDERTSPKAKKDVMIWDVESQQIVGNNVYDVESTPSVGQTAKFETYSAEYVGTGS
jgi:gas vesicle protein